MRIIKISVAFYLLIGLISCSSIEPVTNDDALRINLDSLQYISGESNPQAGKINPMVEPNTGKSRSPATLRGNVFNIYVNKQEYLTESGELAESEQRFYVFLDSLAYNVDNPEYEFIPEGLVQNMGIQVGMPDSTYWVESYNNPLDPPIIRQLPIETKEVNDCACGDLMINVPPCDGCEVPDIKCPFPWKERAQNRSWYFVETRFSYAYYNNQRFNPELSFIEEYPTDAGAIEVAAGYRFQDRWKNHFGLGVMYTTGQPMFSESNFESVRRPSVMLHGRYQFDEIFCLFPFLYADFGLTIDEASLYLGRISYSANIDGFLDIELCDCDEEGDIDGRLRLAQEAAADSPDVDLSIPISWGIGGGIDIPVHKYFDLSFDLGYRYVSYGDEVRLYGYAVPTRIGNGMFILRAGFTF
ncbi:MAG: hypothetical protein Kapaf2KO_14370 [Candidatus Kapaibacteriales bacterium]